MASNRTDQPSFQSGHPRQALYGKAPSHPKGGAGPQDKGGQVYVG